MLLCTRVLLCTVALLFWGTTARVHMVENRTSLASTEVGGVVYVEAGYFCVLLRTRQPTVPYSVHRQASNTAPLYTSMSQRHNVITLVRNRVTSNKYEYIQYFSRPEEPRRVIYSYMLQ